VTTRGQPPEWWTHRHPCPKCGQVHERCASHNREGRPCGKRARIGHWVCATHGGAAPQVRAQAAENEVERKATEALARMRLGAGELVIDPAEAMLQQVRKAAFNVEVYEQAIADLRPELGDLGGRDTVALQLLGAQTITIAPHTLVELYNAERDRLVKYSAECRRAGVEERRIEITAELGRQLVAILRAATAGIFALVRAEVEAGHLDLERLGVIETVEVPALVAAEVARVRAEGSAA
jgi:hypothetical protein